MSETPCPVMSIAEGHARLTAPGERFEIEDMPPRNANGKIVKTEFKQVFARETDTA